jgi:hypothetical protein
MKSLSKILLVAALLAGSGYTYANPSATVKLSSKKDTQDRHLSGFHAIDLSGSFDVYITQGASESVKVEAPSDVMDHVVTEVQDGVLKIHDKHESGWNWGGWNNHKKIAVYVTISNLTQLGVTGSGDAYFKDGLRGNAIKIRVSGSGDVLGKLDVKTLDCNISGSGDMKLSGHAESSNISVSGSGDYEAKGLSTTNTTVHVSGSGDAGINVTTNLEASVSGSGDVSFTGHPHNVVKSKSGSGDIDGD